MDTTLDEKLINLAFNPAASEGEAVNAFLMYRRKFAKIPMLTPPAPKAKPTISWKITLAARYFDGLFVVLNTWKKTPFYAINILEDRSRVIDSWKIQLVCELENETEKIRFNQFFDKAFDRLIS